ncbi:MAG: VanZ family protein [Ruminococcus flavefaciens]|nr:VanZ family protein [Ruminococcus flavefaciens]MCM1059961.1 VanZ family protein [Eubacterium sp.]
MKSKFSTISRIFFIIAAIICMAVIFNFSSENAEKSSDTSGVITDKAVHTFVKDYEKMPSEKKTSIREKVSHIVRKTAHFSIYAALGFCISMAAGKRKLFTKGSAFTVMLCFIYAFSDELHQNFIPGRSCEFKDMMIDTAGATAGMLLSLIMLMLIHKTIIIKNKNLS